MDDTVFLKNIALIRTQTDYDEETAKQKLELFNNDPIKVIKDYLGIVEKPRKMQSVNQEIFKQIRTKLYVPSK
jgi:hypothetical protein